MAHSPSEGAIELPALVGPSLSVRRWSATDRGAFLGLFADPAVMRYIGDGVVDPARDAKLFDKVLELGTGPEERFALLAAVEFDGRIVGHLELKRTENTAALEWEMVYALAPEVWGQGIGSAIAAWAHSTARRFERRMIATIHPDNIASIRVLAKVGLEVDRRLEDGTLLLREPD